MEESTIERNTAIRDARTPAELKAQAERFGISLSHAYRLRKGAPPPATPEHFQGNMTSGLLFRGMSTYGLKHYGGVVDEDYDRAFKPLSKKVKVFREMGDDPIVAAVLQAIKMLIRRVGWYVQPAGSKKADRDAAAFLETCMGDMSMSWMDAIDQALAMLQYGFSAAEIVYKRRQGDKKEAGSIYDDGKIGWRKWLYLAPYSLAPGEPWTFTDTGGIESINQLDFYTTSNAQQVNVPIEKAILFRTTAENNNPEGRSILRPMYWPYYIKRNLEEIEAISAERLGAGLPVVYAGQDVAKGTDPNTDFEKLKDIVRNVRVDEQMGVAIPFAKMGGGAREGEGVLFELLTPTGGKAVDFNQVITRYSQQMAMSGLAQFIHLGMNSVGARALGETSQDFFTLSVSGWADLIEETIHHYATERLMKLNNFPGITGYPRIVHESIVRKSLTELADYINKLVGSMVITPDPDLEKYLREMAELPEKKEAPVVKTPPPPETPPPPPPPPPEPGVPPTETPPPETPEQPPAPEAEAPKPAPTEAPPPEKASETFTALTQALGEAAQALRYEPPAENFGELITALREATRELMLDQPAPQFNVTLPQSVQHFAVNMPDQPAPVVNVTNETPPAQVTVNVPEQAAPIVNVTNETPANAPAQITVNVPEQPPPIVNVTNEAPTIEIPAAQVTVNLPEQPAAQVTVNVPEQPPAQVTVNLPEQQAPKRKVRIQTDKDGKPTGATIESVPEEPQP